MAMSAQRLSRPDELRLDRGDAEGLRGADRFDFVTDLLAELCLVEAGLGERAALADSSVVLAKRLKAATDLPVAMGFGISTPDQAAAVAEHADGVVVASALMRARLDGADPEQLGAMVATFRAALD